MPGGRLPYKRILVTGGAGFIGSNFVNYILKYNSKLEVVNLDALTYAGNLENLSALKGNKRHRFILGNICNKQIVEKAMAGCDAVVHFAAESHVDRSISGPSIFIKTNIIGTQVLLEAALKNQVKRFHHVSTDEVFGELPLKDKRKKFSEKTPYDPRSPYSASKAASDHLVRAFHSTYGLPITISNCSNNYGPFHFPEKIIPLFITNALENKPLPIYGKGRAIRDYLFVTDHCRAIAEILKRGKEGQTYCVGGGAERNGLQVAEAILRATGRDKSLIRFVEDRKGHDMRYGINFRKITRELGWKPSIEFDDGIKKTVKWYIENEKWWRNIISGEYLDKSRRLMNSSK